jgi:UDP-glucose 4-epimerase
VEVRGKRIVITGGAGFIGSHLAEAVAPEASEVVVLDNFSSGRPEFLSGLRDGTRVERVDILEGDLAGHLRGADAVFHMAADPDVRSGQVSPSRQFDQNVTGTYRVLEAMRRVDVAEILFPSTSTVYGEAKVVPTPEGYGPLLPISLYGASKLSGEALISAYAGTFGFRASIFRFANIVGPRSTHGVIHDFINKLRADPNRLEILGRPPGTRKSYCHVDDCVSGLLAGHRSVARGVEVFNIGSDDWTTVQDIADIVVDGMGLRGVEYGWTGGVDDGRGWRGDVREMRLSLEKLKATGWRPRFSSSQAIAQAVRALLGKV